MMKFNENNIQQSFTMNKNAESAYSAMGISLRRFPIMLKNYVSVLDEESGDIVYCIPLSDINKCNKDIKKIVLDDLLNNWKKAGFVVKQEQVPEMYNIGFMSLIYRLSA